MSIHSFSDISKSHCGSHKKMAIKVGRELKKVGRHCIFDEFLCSFLKHRPNFG